MMTEFGFNANYLTKDNEPWFPIMGEIHYSRYPKKYWKESLYKMKAGGVEVVSSYAIWIHHEEIENEFDFSGNRDLNAYVKAVKECGLYLLLRIGPWVHGEARNGGFPDWLMKKRYELRSNDAGYLNEVKKYYTELFKQVKGLLLKDGGPIIGVQIENELGHCGGAWGEAGEEHMRTLYQMAVEIGFDVPYYTATGWGGAVTGGLLPVMGGYCEAPWDQRLTEIEPSGNYVITYERNDHGIGSDHRIGSDVTFDYAKFPFLTAELGGGMQVTHHRRPVAEAPDIGAMSLTKLASGCNLLGYYMYHGGTNPKGKLSTLQESRATGYLNDYTELSYDFRAPIREFGQMSDTLKEIKLYAMFVKDFGSSLCSMPAYIPDDNPTKPSNLHDLRYSFRHDGKSGYAFVNNYQRRYPMDEHKAVKLSVSLPEETITFPEITVKDKEYFFYPFNLQLGTAVLKKAMATPLCILNNPDKAYVFYGDRDPGFDVIGDLSSTRLINLSRRDAMNAWKIKSDKEYLIISDAAVLQTDLGVEMIGRDTPSFKIYPDLPSVPAGFVKLQAEGEFTVYEKKIDFKPAQVNYRLLSESTLSKMYEITIEYPKDKTQDYFLQFTYQGDSARLCQDGRLITDHYYTGKDWEVGLKQFDLPEKLTMEVYPLSDHAEVFLEQWPIMKDGVACELSMAKTYAEYRTVIITL